MMNLKGHMVRQEDNLDWHAEGSVLSGSAALRGLGSCDPH